MATKVTFNVGTTNGPKNMTFNRVKSNANSSLYKAMADALVANGSIYKYPPLVINYCKLTTTTETMVDVSDDD